MKSSTKTSMYCNKVKGYGSEGSLAVGTLVYDGENEFSVLAESEGCSVLAVGMVGDIGISRTEAWLDSG